MFADLAVGRLGMEAIGDVIRGPLSFSRRIVVRMGREQFQELRAISVIRGCPRNALTHRVMQDMPGALVNNPG